MMTRLQTAAIALAELGADEQRVVEMFIDRLHLGARQYGALDAETDRRDLDTELREELLDAIVYALTKSLQLKPGQRHVTKPRAAGLRHAEASPIAHATREALEACVDRAFDDAIDLDVASRLVAEAAYRFAAPILFGEDNENGADENHE